MNPHLLPFYTTCLGSALGNPSKERAAPVPSAMAPVPSNGSVRPATPCSHGTTTGCRLTFRSKACCYAVQDHACDPPSELLLKFVEGGGPITMAQVYIANGCHR